MIRSDPGRSGAIRGKELLLIARCQALSNTATAGVRQFSSAVVLSDEQVESLSVLGFIQGRTQQKLGVDYLSKLTAWMWLVVEASECSASIVEAACRDGSIVIACWK